MDSIKDQVILITGSTDGIGKIAAIKLAQMGATVLVHGRSREKCAETVEEIRDRSKGKKPGYYVADLSSLNAVRTLAKEIASDHRYLNVLISNACIGSGKPSDKTRPLSRDGHELHWAVNYLAPFLLTRLLIPVLKHARPSRIVNVASAAQERIDFSDVMLARSYTPWRAYSRSKLALIMFTFEMSQRLKDKNLTVNCLHPGSLLDTKMVRESSLSPLGSPESGAAVEIYAATDPDLEGRTGLYFEERHEARAHEQAYDIEARKRLWRLSEELTG